MADIAEQKDIADEIAAAISTSPQDLPTDEVPFVLSRSIS